MDIAATAANKAGGRFIGPLHVKECSCWRMQLLAAGVKCVIIAKLTQQASAVNLITFRFICAE